MNSVFKKILSVVLAVAMLASMAVMLGSCGDKNGDDNAFVVGASGPLTGDAASYGISVQNGAKLAIKHINAKGGIQFTLNMKDDKADPKEAAANYDILYDAGMQVSLGGVTSGAGEAFAKKANVDQVFCMTPSGSADPVIKDMEYSFRLCFGDPDQGVLAAQEIKDKGYTKVGALYDTSDTYSSGIYAAFKTEMARLGINYTEQTFDAENKTDFNTQAGVLADCDVVFMPFYYNEAQLFIKAAVSKGSDAVFFGCDGFDGIAGYIENVENKVMYITPFDVNATDAQTKAFVDAYVAEYGSKPDQFAADAYDVMMVIAAAMDKAGVTDYDISASELGEILVETVTAADFSYDGLTGKMTWDASGACTKEPNIVEFN